MKRGEFLIVNRLGLHARAAAQLVKTAHRFAADITLLREDMEVNAKSILGVLMLAASKGSTIQIRCEGAQADEAYEALAALVDDGFGEM